MTSSCFHFMHFEQKISKYLNVVPIKAKKCRKQQPNEQISLIMGYLPKQFMELISNTATRKISYHATDTCIGGGGRKGREKNRWGKI